MVTGLNTVFSCTTNFYVLFSFNKQFLYFIHSIDSKQLMNSVCNQNVAVYHVSVHSNNHLTTSGMLVSSVAARITRIRYDNRENEKWT